MEMKLAASVFLLAFLLAPVTPQCVDAEKLQNEIEALKRLVAEKSAELEKTPATVEAVGRSAPVTAEEAARI